MKKFLPAIFFATLLLPISTLPSLAGCSPITTAGCASGSYCSASNLCCTVASDCSVPLTNTAATTKDDPILQNCDPTTKALGKGVPQLEYLACAMDAGSKQNNSPWYQPTPQQFSEKVFHGGTESDIYGERYTFAQVNWIINSLLTLMNPFAGKTPAESVDFISSLSKILSFNPNSPPTAKDYAKLGPLMLIGQIMEWPYTHPVASGIQETKTMALKIFDLGTGTQPTYAQGLGYKKLGMGNIQNLWKASRNISYLCIIILLIASGFMVMFRTQVNPQTVVTVQMVIPKLILALILITFSYAIVGFVIDGIYISIVAILGLINTVSPNFIISLPTAIQTLTGQNGLLGGNFNFVLAFLWMPILFAVIFLVILVVLPIWVSLQPVAPTLGIVLVPLLAAFFGVFAWAIYVAARIIGQLLLAYLNIIILTISGPLQIMLDILPNRKSSAFVGWFKCVVANASVFVTYIVLAIIAKALFNFGGLSLTPGSQIDNFGFNIANTQLRESFQLPGADFNLNFNSPMSIVWWLLLGMGYFTAVPSIVDGIKNSLCKSEDQSKFIENFVKDTVGQFSKAGQNAGEGITKGRAREAGLLGDKGPSSLTDLPVPGSGGGGPNP